MTRILLLSVGLMLILGSCVTNKKYVYLQKDDVNVKGLPKDSVMREYDLADFDYKIQPNDLISIQFESLTPDEFNFLRQSGGYQAGNMNLSQGGGLLFGELVDENGEIKLFCNREGKSSRPDHIRAAGTAPGACESIPGGPHCESQVVEFPVYNFRGSEPGRDNHTYQ